MLSSKTRARPLRTGKLTFALLASIMTGILPASPARAAPQAREDCPIHQLRIYEIFEHNKAAFHARFRDHAVRIMRRYDFDIVAMWEAESPERTEFVYIIAWPDRASMEDRWAKFMADQEWSDIKKRSAAEHGKLVGEIESRALRLTGYSRPLGVDRRASLTRSGHRFHEPAGMFDGADHAAQPR